MKRLFPRLALMVLLAPCTQAFAHAFLDKSEPKVGGTVTVSPTEVKIWFTDDTQPDKSAIEVFDSSGNQIDKKDTHGDPDNKSILIVSLPPLSAGTYTVRWHALCPDSHQTQGDFKFTVKPPPATPALRAT